MDEGRIQSPLAASYTDFAHCACLGARTSGTPSVGVLCTTALLWVCLDLYRDKPLGNFWPNYSEQSLCSSIFTQSRVRVNNLSRRYQFFVARICHSTDMSQEVDLCNDKDQEQRVSYTSSSIYSDVHRHCCHSNTSFTRMWRIGT
jgi:hypothetical protein